MRECPRNTRLGYGGAVSGKQKLRQGREVQVLRCYNCHCVGHVAAKCPSTTLRCTVRVVAGSVNQL